MAAPPARARADYDYLIKLLLIGDSGTCDSHFSVRINFKYLKCYIVWIACEFEDIDRDRAVSVPLWWNFYSSHM